MLQPATPTVACDLPDAGCVEVTLTADGTAVEVRDTKNPAAPALRYTCAEWREFIAGVKTGRFDLPGDRCSAPPQQSVRRVLAADLAALVGSHPASR